MGRSLKHREAMKENIIACLKKKKTALTKQELDKIMFMTSYTTLSLAVDEMYSAGQLTRTGTGAKNAPFRYYIPEGG